MQIVIEKTTRRAVLAFQDGDVLSLQEDGLHAPDLFVSDLSTATHEIVDAAPPVPPMYWVPGALTYTVNEWAVLDRDTYDKHVGQSIAIAFEEMRRNRAAEYPPVTDYLDGIVKGDAEQVQAYIDACLAVKLKYPKPTE